MPALNGWAPTHSLRFWFSPAYWIFYGSARGIGISRVYYQLLYMLIMGSACFHGKEKETYRCWFQNVFPLQKRFVLKLETSCEAFYWQLLGNFVELFDHLRIVETSLSLGLHNYLELMANSTWSGTKNVIKKLVDHDTSHILIVLLKGMAF